MQTATFLIRLSKSDTAITNITRENVTPAEALCFQQQKGKDAVKIIGDVCEIHRSFADEKERLLIAHKDAFLKCFPGSSASLPSRFEDIGLSYGDEEEASEEEQKPKAKAKPKKKAGAEDPSEDDEFTKVD